MKRRQFIIGGAGTIAAGATGAWTSETEAAHAQTPAQTANPNKQRLVTVWSEGTAPQSVYPNDINGAIVEGLAGLPNCTIRRASLTDPQQGLDDATLNQTDVLFWWGHIKHGAISDETVQRIVRRVKEDGMGIIFLHSAHYAKPLKAILNASGSWGSYINDGRAERVGVVSPNHPIARGVRPFTVPKEERYDEPFEVPDPEAVVFDAVYEGNNKKARQGLCWTIGKGRVFYLRLGHEEYPVYYMPQVRRILRNAALWAMRDEAAILEDNDPFARAARATKEPPLAHIARDAGYGGTDITAGGEVSVQRWKKAGKDKPRFTPLAAYGVEKVSMGGWYEAPNPTVTATNPPKKHDLWKIGAKNNKRMAPPLERKSKTDFEPGNKPFGLWIASEGFPGETIYTEDPLQAFVKRFPEVDRHKAHVYAAVKTDGTAVPNTYLVGFEYSTNNDNQEIVGLLEGVEPA